MWYEIFKFEIKYRAKRPDTYIFFIFLFLFSIVAVDFIYQGVDLGQIKKNSPLVIAKTMGALTGITMLIASLIMGVPILRDFEYNIESLMFVNPIKKRDYLLGKFLGSFVILLIIFSAVVFGNAIGEFMPWRNSDEMLPFNFMVYLQPFFTVVLPILFFGSAIFFISGSLSKKLLVVYTQGLFIFVLFILTRGIENEFIGAILDPFSLNTLSTMTDLWSVAEKNTQLIPFNGVLLYSKLFYVIISIIILIIGYIKFNYNVVTSTASKKKLELKDATTDDEKIKIEISKFTIQTGFKASCIQLFQHSIFYLKSILKEVSFWAIVICAMVIIFINSISLGTVWGVNSYPATYFIVEELLEMSGYFFIIILVFYSGELIWKERGVKINLIYDALPNSDIINLLGKYIGLIVTYMVLMLSLILAGVIFQSFNGYYNFELDVYFISFFGDFLPFLMLYTVISFFIHSLVNNKFIGYILMLTFFIITGALPFFGYTHFLNNFGGNNLGVYSQMNGYGHFLKPFIWIKAYWFVFCAIIFLISAVLVVRGTETNIKYRWKQVQQNLSKSILSLGAISVVALLLLGSFIYYNTTILNTYWTNSEQLVFRAGYEQTLKKFEHLAQPKIIDVNLNVELYPETRDYVIEGYYILTNTHNKPIYDIHVQKLIDDQIKLEYVDFEGGSNLNEQYNNYHYHIYTLKNALAPGDSIKMKFKQSFTTVGFENSNSNTHIVNNGTFFTNKDLPSLGYNKKYELREDDDREEFGFTSRKGMATRKDEIEISNGINGDDGYEINFEIVIGTEADQIGIAPGSLLKEWEENNRNYFHYKMEEPMINFYSIVSARYEVLKDTWIPKQDSLTKSVDLEIYFHKGHEYNLDRMMESMKMSFDYYGSNFSKYPYQQMRIMEFPRYAEFAQSFPTAVPFSESLGFMLDIDDEKDVDMVFFITAHELAHQWWGLQVVASNVQGRNMILETLAQYSALMVMKQKYPEEKIQQFLKMENNLYFEGRASEDIKELSLAMVEKQKYIYYRKGAINMYTLQDYIGEANVNLALKRFIAEWNAFDESNKKDRYATTEDLLKYFREVTPSHLQYLITDLFENVVLYDNKIENVNTEKLDNEKYAVAIDFTISKYTTDIKGNRMYNQPKNDSLINYNDEISVIGSMPLSDYIDIVVFGEEEKDGVITSVELYKKKHKITKIYNKLRIIVDQKPTEVGVDPYHKLIDKNLEDNRKEL